VVQASVSQSVERTVQILALFEKERRPLARAEICEALDAPRSSMAALLQAITELGILAVDRTSQTYFPTARLGRLAGWIDRLFSIDEPIARLVKQAQTETRETVTLTTPLHDVMEVVHLEPGLNTIAYVAAVGQVIPMWGSAAGNAYLSTLPDKRVAELHRRATATLHAPVPEPGVLMTTIARTRAEGYSLVAGIVAPDAAALAMPLPPRAAGDRPLVIVLSGPRDRIVQGEAGLVRTLRAAMAGNT
jgi:IclR family acetate operon transcriptional repressor